MALDSLEFALRGDLIRDPPSASQSDRQSTSMLRLVSFRAIQDSSNSFAHMVSWLPAGRTNVRHAQCSGEVPQPRWRLELLALSDPRTGSLTFWKLRVPYVGNVLCWCALYGFILALHGLAKNSA